MLELPKVRYYDHVPLVSSNFSASRTSPRGDGDNGLYQRHELIPKMYLVQFINPTKSLVAIHAVMSQKFEFACNDGDVPGVRPRG